MFRDRAADRKRLLAARWTISKQFPDFEHLHRRHPWLSNGLSLMLAEAARVALDRHHKPAATDSTIATKDLTVASGGTSDTYTASWTVPTERERKSHANRKDATEDGAYCLAIAAVEARMEMFALGRTQQGSGADFWVDVDPHAEYLDAAHRVRLEVSGTDAGAKSTMKTRLKQKTEQTQRGSVNGPAIAAVVGFQAATIELWTA